LLLTKNREQSFLLNFVTKFREEYASKKSNIWLYDDEQIYDLIGKYPLYGAEKDIFANHLIAGSTFDAPDNIWLYPDK
jgi:Tol biopolymer transport system component